ncbi:MAG: PD-(D/E)XK nuclease family protein, partial [Pseudomonadota bacterium]
NPYNFYCQSILRLRKLNPLVFDDSARVNGILTHYVLEALGKKFPEGALPNNSAEIVKQIATKIYEPLSDHKDYPRIMRRWHEIIPMILRFERTSRSDFPIIHVEINGELIVALGNKTIKLTGRTDRIGVSRIGALQIVDYKTGTLPRVKEVTDMRKPQLTILTLIATKGVYPDWDKLPAPRKVESLQAWKISAQNDKRTSYMPKKKDSSLDDWLSESYDMLVQIIAHMHDPDNGFPSTSSVPQQSDQFIHDDYALLARACEWGRIDGQKDNEND